MTIKDVFIKYRRKLDYLDLELIIAHILRKPREFVLAHPEYKLTKNQELRIKNYVLRRIKHEPIAYILGKKEFFGLDFRVDRRVLIPRPETEMLVDLAIKKVGNKKKKIIIIDIGTGSGNIIISVACNIKHETYNKIKYYATDVSGKALVVAKQNAKMHKIGKKVKFLKGDLIRPIIKNLKLKIKNSNLIILANLPYLSQNIYKCTSRSVKNFEPKSALFSTHQGLAHYEKLLKQMLLMVNRYMLHVTCYMEFSPEQKLPLQKLIKKYLPEAKITFYRDLTKRWRICEIGL
jgi:release factor glutamine methyltransferase